MVGGGGAAGDASQPVLNPGVAAAGAHTAALGSSLCGGTLTRQQPKFGTNLTWQGRPWAG